jgi:hypothetical protein
MARRLASLLGTIAIGLLIVTGPARAQTLWQSAKIGMTPDEVKALFSDAVAGSGLVKGGATEGLRLADYAMLDRRFDVGFWFAGGRLERVVLEARDLDRAGGEGNLATVSRLATMLGEKYGGSSCQTARGVAILQNCEWTTPAVKIDLIYVDLGDQPVLLAIYYQARRPMGGDRL